MEGRDQIQLATHCSSPPGVADIQMRVTTVKKVGEGWGERWRVGGREKLVEAVRLLKWMLTLPVSFLEEKYGKWKWCVLQ